jgi:DNA-binding CsgD family transcriptional regulator
VLVAAGLGLAGPADLDQLGGRMSVHSQSGEGGALAPGRRSTDSGRRDAVRLIGRRRECGTLDRLIEAVRAGESRALVVRGEPGVGKTVLLDYLAGQARRFRVARAVGMQTEMELAFAGLHQLCAPMLDHADSIPAPQRDALQTAFGLAAGPPPDRFLVGLGVLSLLSEVAGQGPVICLVDDEQWLDQASAQALGFSARRLGADSVGLVFAAREPGAELAGLPELEVRGLRDDDARALLDAALPGPLDARVRDLIVAETHGNPLALLELPRGLSPAQLAGGFGLPSAAPLSGRIEGSFARQLAALPTESRRLLQLAAADPSGDRSLVWRAAGQLGIPVQARTPAVEAGLVEFGAGIRFRHPLARSAAYRSAAMPDRQQMHAALAEVTDPQLDPDRRAWHRAQAAAGPDEEVAAELERSAGRAQARGGLAAAAAFLERTVMLTADPARRPDRALSAAQAALQAGAFDAARGLLGIAEDGELDEFQHARSDLLRAQVAFSSGVGSDAATLLLKAAKRLESLDLDLARDTYLDALGAAALAGPAGAGARLEVCRAARALPPPARAPRPIDLLLDGLALLVTEGRAAAAATLRAAARVFIDEGLSIGERLRWGWLASAPTYAMWDNEATRAVLARQIQLVRDAGALEQLPIYLSSLGTATAWTGDFAAAASLIAETKDVAAATGARLPPFTALVLVALTGRETEAFTLIRATIDQAEGSGQEAATTMAQYAAAVIYNGLRRYEEAVTAAQQACWDPVDLYGSGWALPELVEASIHCGQAGLARDALERLAAATRPAGTDWGLGIEARSRALLSEGAAASQLYREAIDRLGRARLRPDLARAHLVHGEWLRRQGRRVDAREQLRAAYEQFTSIGMEAFAERARMELQATGEKIRSRAVETQDELTAQERQIAELAGRGLSNPEIGTQLFISARTVEWHLSKVFIKLGVSSRRQLNQALPAEQRAARQS